MTKDKLLKALAKIPDDEELFLLRGQDFLAPGLVRYWAGAARAKGCREATADEARECANRMEKHPKRKWPE